MGLIQIAFDASDVHDLLVDLHGALDTKGHGHPLRGGFPAQAAGAIGAPVLKDVRDRIDKALGENKGRRRSANRVVYQRRRSDGSMSSLIEVGDAQTSLRTPSFPKALRQGASARTREQAFVRLLFSDRGSFKDRNQIAPGARSRRARFTPDMVRLEKVDTDSGFVVGIGNIQFMDLESKAQSIRGKQASLWRVLEGGAKQSAPYTTAHKSPTGKQGWLAVYENGPNFFRLWVPQQFRNPARSGKHFFRAAENAVYKLKKTFMPEVLSLVDKAIMVVWSRPPKNRRRTLHALNAKKAKSIFGVTGDRLDPKGSGFLSFLEDVGEDLF